MPAALWRLVALQRNLELFQSRERRHGAGGLPERPFRYRCRGTGTCASTRGYRCPASGNGSRPLAYSPMPEPGRRSASRPHWCCAILLASKDCRTAAPRSHSLLLMNRPVKSIAHRRSPPHLRIFALEPPPSEIAEHRAVGSIELHERHGDQRVSMSARHGVDQAVRHSPQRGELSRAQGRVWASMRHGRLLRRNGDDRVTGAPRGTGR